MKFKISLLVLLLSGITIGQALPNDSILVETDNNVDLTVLRYSDHHTFWGFSLGYFQFGKKILKVGESQHHFIQKIQFQNSSNLVGLLN